VTVDFGIMTAKVDEIGYIARAENLVWKAYLDWLSEAPPAVRHQRLHGSHYSFVDPDEARFVTADLIKATCLSGTPSELVEQIKSLERQGLRQIMLYPPLNRQYRVIEDFADKIMARL
jgi:alkanesulfonate monooxygenase SsuD/methylene tetrahydromethanopterin reductase-like flavin-dependent oxidoreductase (luciferase family)